MLRTRTTARAALALLILWVSAATANAAVPKKLIFPVVGKSSYTNDFGDPRGQGRHQGNDIMAPWRAPVVAVESGRVEIWNSSWRAGCMLYLYGRSGTTYMYVHLNNDLTPKNDNRGGCKRGVAYAKTLRDGQQVRAGRLIGYVGDSGDANGIPPHLHFELHPAGRGAVSPYPWLRTARRVIFATPPGSTAVALRLRGTVRWIGRRVAIRATAAHVMGTSWTARIGRNVYLARPPGMLVQRVVDGAQIAAAPASAVNGERVTVWTASVRPTLAAQFAEIDALSAKRVLLRGLAR